MKKQSIEYEAPELQGDGSLERHSYRIEGSEEEGWTVYREGKPQLKLGPGYTPVRTRYCGVCSTDLARHFLPYPLPQIVGHEVVAEKQGRFYTVEINASERARGLASEENPYSLDSMHTQDPRRITLGINQLPGGFAPWLLAPVNSLVPVPETLALEAAALTEPFAAALQAVEATAPQEGERIAVLGPRRLGSLLLTALAGYRKQNKINFHITAIARHKHILKITKEIGADETINLQDFSSLEEALDSLRGSFGVVFDTTGHPDGLRLSLELARRAVHLKSTNGQEVEGLRHLTDLVVDEMALLPYSKERLAFTWPREMEKDPSFRRKNTNVFAAPSVSKKILEEAEKAGHRVFQGSIEKTAAKMFAKGPLPPPADWPDFLQGSPFPRFDLALATSLEEVDAMLRPIENEEWGLVRARGAILLISPCLPENNLTKALCKRGLELHTSRCGDFARALKILADNPDLAKALKEQLVTQIYPLEKIEEAFATARDSKQSLKVLVDCAG